MTLVQWDAETGTDGAALTTGNTGGSQVTTGTGCAATFAATSAMHGSLGYRFVAASGGQTFMRQAANASNKVMAVRFYFRADALPTTGQREISTIRYATGVAVNIYLDSTGKIILQDHGFGNSLTSAETFTAGTYYRAELLLNAGTTTSNGTIHANYYLGDSATPLNGSAYTSSVYNMNASAITGADIGSNDTGATTITLSLDDFALSDGATTEIGPVVTTRQGSGAGSVGFTGTAAGARTPKASGAGTVGFTGTAAGVVAFAGTTTGSVRFTGSATGLRSPKATCTGAVAFAGTASGTAPTVGGKFGNAAGALHLTGAAIGSTTRQGSVAGVLSLTGTVTGRTSRQGSATGVVGFTTIAAGTNQDAADITVTAALDPRPWASTLTTRTNTGLLVQRSWEARLE